MVRWFVIAILTLTINAQEIGIQILTTTNLRGHILPQNSYTLQPANQGWAKAGTIIRNLKIANHRTVIIDCGNTIQGEPINYVWYQLGSNLPEPSMAIMNNLKYNAMLVGSSELCCGLERLRTIESQAKFPWLAANIVRTSDGHKIFTPYKVTSIGDIRVAVLGLTITTQSLPIDAPGGISFQDPVTVTKALVPTLRQKERADLIVLAINGDSNIGLNGKNLNDEISAIVSQVPNIDLVIVNSTNQKVSSEINGIPVLQAGQFGTTVGVVRFWFRRNSNGTWEPRFQQRENIAITAETICDSKIMELTAPLRIATETYLNTFATNLSIDLDSRWSRMESTAVMQLLHSVAKRASSADVTAIATPCAKIFIPKGLTSVRQFYSLYPNDDHLIRIRITGRQLRTYLEHSAHFYTFSYHPELFNKNFNSEDFDTLDGCNYSLDISKPLGSRVVKLQIHGQPVKDAQNLTMCICSNRMSGAGGYLEAIGWSGKPEFVSNVPFRNLIMEYVLSQQTLSINTTNNWHIVPALDRERVLIQQP